MYSFLTITGQPPPVRNPSSKSVQSLKRVGFWLLSMYICTMVHERSEREPIEVERVQTGVRLEKRMLKVLKAIAEQKDMTLGDLLEGIVLHAFEGKAPFSQQTLKEIEQFKTLYGMSLKAADSHNLKERRR